MKPLSILHINTMDQGGGAAQLAFNLVQASNTAGHKATLAVRAKKSQRDFVSLIENDANRHGWARFCLRTLEKKNGSQRLARLFGRPWDTARVLWGHEDFDFPGVWRMLARLSYKPDLLHLHNLHGNYFDLRALPWLSHQIPTVVTLHDAWMMSGHCSHGFDCERWRTGCGHCPDLSIYPSILRDATAYNWRRKQAIYSKSRLHVVAPARWLMKKASESMLAPAIASSRVIHHGIDLSVFKPGDRAHARIELGLPPYATILLFAAAGIRDNIWKDYQTMRRAFETLGSSSGRQGLLFLAVGDDGPAEKIGGNELRFIPHSSDRARLAKYFQAADVYVHGAKAEAWGLTITEAMACGLPVVASDVGGISDQVAEGQSGFLVPVGGTDLMAARIEMLVADHGLRESMARWAQERAHAEFGLDHMTQNYLRLYESVLETHGH
jgi:glycosyltransferase involved in cell wall biosynthesis